MKRAAIYARYSSDLQSDRSIEDQYALCQQFASRQGYVVVAKFEDRARSGASIFGRTGLSDLMSAAKDRSFDVVLVESLDRISRDQEDMAAIFKRLTFEGIDIVTVHEGRVDQIQVGVRGIVSALYLTDLANKIRRGAAGNIREGKHAGGLAYGYRPTPGRPGEWVIFEEEAEIIRRIYTEYVNGDSPRDIAHRLNKDGIKPPRGEFWRATSLIGSRSRSYGILANSVYTGRLVWNRIRMVKDPNTGRRVSRPNPESEWIRKEVPELRILSDELYDAAQKIRSERSRVAPTHRKKPRHLLSGLLRCGCCGGGLSVKDTGDKQRVYCTRHRESKSCNNNRSIQLRTIEASVLDGIRARLLDPEAISIFLKRYHAERKRLAKEAGSRRHALEKRIGEISRRIDKAIKVLLDSDGPVKQMAAAIREMEDEKEKLEQELAGIEAEINVVTIHPAAHARYLEIVKDIGAGLRTSRTPKLTAEIRSLIDSVIVTPQPKPSPPKVEVVGKLEKVLQDGSGGPLQSCPPIRLRFLCA